MSILDNMKRAAAVDFVLEALGAELPGKPEHYRAEPQLLEEDLRLMADVVREAHSQRESGTPTLWGLAQAVDALAARRTA